MLPGLKSYATCIRFAPYLFRLTGAPTLLSLPYQMVFAVGSCDQLLLFSTEAAQPLAVIGNLHLANINDLTWSGSCQLVACSSDGYCSLV